MRGIVVKDGRGGISNVTLLMLISPIDHFGGHCNNPDSNADDLGCYANDTWRDRMQ